MPKNASLEKTVAMIISCLGLAGIVFLEFYFIEYSLFEQFPNIGIGFHLFGGFFVAVMVYYMFIESLSRLDWPLVMIFILGAVCMAAVGWECFEWILEKMTGSLYQVSLDNTMEDLVVGMSGSLLACPLLLMRNMKFGKLYQVESIWQK